MLAVGLTISSLVISGALQNMRVARDRVIATQLAREGLEAMRNIRDTNWLKFSNNRRACWNHFPGDTLLSDLCEGNTPILPGEYIVYKSDEFRWKLDETTQTNEDATPLSKVDIDGEVDRDLDGETDNDTDLFNHLLTTDEDPLGQRVQSTIFKRTLTIEYLENKPDPLALASSQTEPKESINTADEWSDLLDSTAVNRMRLTATVTWQEGNDAEHRVELKTILTDYLGRSQLEG